MKELIEAKNFLILGLLNFLITNFILQISLLFLPIWISTLISQIFNFVLGFYLYGKLVFKKRILNNIIAFKYFMISFLSWIINTILIYLISVILNYSKSISAIIVIPILVFYSFIAQKYFVFRNKKN